MILTNLERFQSFHAGLSKIDDFRDTRYNQRDNRHSNAHNLINSLSVCFRNGCIVNRLLEILSFCYLFLKKTVFDSLEQQFISVVKYPGFILASFRKVATHPFALASFEYISLYSVYYLTRLSQTRSYLNIEA